MKTKQATQTQTVEQTTQQAAGETAAERVERLKAELKMARAESKTKREKVACSEPGCHLFAMQGREDQKCSNHRPAWERLTEQQKVNVEARLQGKTAEGLVNELGFALALKLAK